MPRMNILNTVEREAFNSPPVSAVSNASSILTSPPSYAASPLASAIRPTSLAFYSAQATSKPRGGSSHQALSTREISSMWRANSSPERRRSTSPNTILAPANVTSTRSGRSMVSGPAILRHTASCSKRSLAWWRSQVKTKVIFWRCIDVLVREKIEVPSYTRLTKLILGAINRRSQELAAIIERSLTQEVRPLLEDLLTQEPLVGDTVPGKTSAPTSSP